MWIQLTSASNRVGIRELLPGCLLALLLFGVGCSSSPTEPAGPSAKVDLSGEYVGVVDIKAFDSVVVCGLGCSYRLVAANLYCRATASITMTGDTAFQGTLRVDTTRAGWHGTGNCQPGMNELVKPLLTHQIAGSIKDIRRNGAPHVTDSLATTWFSIDGGSGESLEAAFGCRILVSWSSSNGLETGSTWFVEGHTVWPKDDLRVIESSTAKMYESMSIGTVRSDRPYQSGAECLGRNVVIEIRIDLERLPE